jgi:hypothetical protein
MAPRGSGQPKNAFAARAWARIGENGVKAFSMDFLATK